MWMSETFEYNTTVDILCSSAAWLTCLQASAPVIKLNLALYWGLLKHYKCQCWCQTTDFPNYANERLSIMQWTQVCRWLLVKFCALQSSIKNFSHSVCSGEPQLPFLLHFFFLRFTFGIFAFIPMTIMIMHRNNGGLWIGMHWYSNFEKADNYCHVIAENRY